MSSSLRNNRAMKLALNAAPIFLAPMLLALFFLAGCHQGHGDAAGGAALTGSAEDTAPFAAISPADVILIAGTEPFWNGRIAEGTLTWTTPQDMAGQAIRVTRFAGRGGLGFSGTLEGQPLDLAVAPGTCFDGMSDRTYPFTVAITLGTQHLSGCGWREGDDLGPPP